jgi:hypothetical protein
LTLLIAGAAGFVLVQMAFVDGCGDKRNALQ